MRTSSDSNDKKSGAIMKTIIDAVNSILGLGADPKNLTFLQISLRGVIVFITALVMIRLGDKRFLSKKTAFDAILGFVLASMLARAVNGSVSFFPTLGGGFVLVGLHRTLAWLARRSHRFGNLVKGRCDLLIEDGIVVERAMRQNNLSEHDLLEDLRLNGNVDDPQSVRAAFVERNGQISVVK
jgi:uncharacterized membrane protein YcaP (DUF421 family)